MLIVDNYLFSYLYLSTTYVSVYQRYMSVLYLLLYFRYPSQKCVTLCEVEYVTVCYERYYVLQETRPNYEYIYKEYTSMWNKHLVGGEQNNDGKCG